MSVFQYLKLNMPLEDEEFNRIYPPSIQQLAKRHWTPVEVAKSAADFLVKYPGAKVLDIGSGAGKFCHVAASATQGYFTGVEQRKDLVDLATKIAVVHEIRNACFIHANVTEIDFSEYNAFYFYNSFQENIEAGARIDENVETDTRFYERYSDYVNLELSRKPAGTRLVTYWSSLYEVPENYRELFSAYNDKLKFWEKIG